MCYSPPALPARQVVLTQPLEDERTNERINQQTNEQTNEQKNEQTKKWMNEQTNKLMNKQMNLAGDARDVHGINKRFKQLINITNSTVAVHWLHSLCSWHLKAVEYTVVCNWKIVMKFVMKFVVKFVVKAELTYTAIYCDLLMTYFSSMIHLQSK